LKAIRKVIYLHLLSSVKTAFLWAWLDSFLCISRTNSH